MKSAIDSASVPLKAIIRQTAKEPIRVHKFGGSSLGSARAFKAAGRVLADDVASGKSSVGVCSAMYGVTNRLVDATEAAVQGDSAGVRDATRAIMDLHAHAAKAVVVEPATRSSVLEFVDQTLKEEVEAHCEGISERGQANVADMDFVTSVGERLSSRMLAAHLNSVGAKAAFVTADKIIVTTDVPGNAMPIMDLTTKAVSEHLLPLLQDGFIGVVTGFYGAADGQLRTLGRGGSDLSAAILGAALNAEEVNLWKVECSRDDNGWLKDWVPGFEGIVHDANIDATVEALSYEEAAQLAHFGKKVLHPETVTPAVKSNIPIRIRNSMNIKAAGTVIASSEFVSASESSGSSDSDTFSLAVAGESSDVSARITTITGASLSLPQYEEKFGKIGPALARNTEADIPYEEAGIIAIVGPGVGEEASVTDIGASVLDILRDAEVDAAIPEKVNGSPHSLSVVVPLEAKKAAVSALHSELIDRA